MRKFQTGDLIRFSAGKRQHYGLVGIIDGDILWVMTTGEKSEKYRVQTTKAEYIEPVPLSEDDARRFARYEVTFSELTRGIDPPERLRTIEPYNITVDDLLSALQRASAEPTERFLAEWFDPLHGSLAYSYEWGDPSLYTEGESGYRFLPSEGYYVWDAMDDLECFVDAENGDFSGIIEKLFRAKALLNTPVEQRLYSDDVKKDYVHGFEKESILKKASEKELALYVRWVNELCRKGEQVALYARAYGCYGGNRAFPCDWVLSRNTLLELIELDENPQLANTLGYIYYYGRCNDGVPEYDKAFYYFSIGAAGGVYESRYKLADMFLHGYGVPKNLRIAARLIWQLYDENRGYILDGAAESKFADIALRMGNLCRDGVDAEQNPDAAYYYYLQAEFAIRSRLLAADHYGDASVAENIRRAVDEILPQTSYTKPCRTMHYMFPGDLLAGTFKKDHRVLMRITSVKDGEFSLKFEILPRGDENGYPRFFVTVPEAHFCGYMDSISVRTEGCEGILVNDELFEDGRTAVVFDSVYEDEFFLYGEKVAEFHCDSYKMTCPAPEKTARHRFVSVAFTEGGRTYDYLCPIPDVAVGDHVVVETDRGETKVEVVRVFEKSESETVLPPDSYKSILRKA